MLSALAVLAAIHTMKQKAKEAEANPTLMEKNTTGLRKVMPIATIDPKGAEVNPKLMGKVVMAIKEHPPMEDMEATARAPLNMLCIINTNWV